MDDLKVKTCLKCKRKAVAFESDFKKNITNKIHFMNGSRDFCKDGCCFDGNIVSLTSISGIEGYMTEDTLLDSVVDLKDISDYETEKAITINEANQFHKAFSQLDN